MTNFKKIALFIFVNVLGFSSMSFNFLLAVQMGVFDENSNENILALRDAFFTNTTIIWSVCALFSLAFFFIEGRAAWAFLLSAFVVPFLYGFSLLLL